MKSFLKYSFVALVAVVAAHAVPSLQEFLFGADVVVGTMTAAVTFVSFAGLRNIEEQQANPPGVRRVGVVAVKDLRDDVIDWPKAVGSAPDVDVETMEITTAIPLKVGKQVAVITPADNSAFFTFESLGDRFYQSQKYAIGFDIAGLTKAQAVEIRKFQNTGCIFFKEMFDGEIRVFGSKLAPIVLKSKGDSGKKGGDKRGYVLSGDNDSYVIEPPFYPETLALPGMGTGEVAPVGG